MALKREPTSHPFISERHIRNVLEGAFVPLVDEAGVPLPDISGRAGVDGMTREGLAMGVDLIEMQPSTAFPLHVHPGQHILYVMHGQGLVHVDGVDYPMKQGDTIFIPAEYPHGVQALDSPLTFLAFGYPHKNIEAADRMRIVAPPEGSG